MGIIIQFNFRSLSSPHSCHHAHQQGRQGQAFTTWRNKNADKPGSKGEAGRGLNYKGKIPFSSFSTWITYFSTREKKR